jgi:SAM-dependent methyltransferase
VLNSRKSGARLLKRSIESDLFDSQIPIPHRMSENSMASFESIKIGKILEGNISKDARILDVGCGYGSKLKQLRDLGYTNVEGVEINQTVVDIVRNEGFNVMSVNEYDLDGHKEKYDLLLMSHIIEHFQYHDLIDFMEQYLSCLKPGGLLLIATPLMNPSFYDDFDHVKPYTHISILSVFGSNITQVQFHSKARLELVNLIYIRLAYQLKFYRALSMETWLYRIPRTINRLLHLIYRLSFRMISQPKVWIGLFRKV